MLIGQDALKAVRGCKLKVAVPLEFPVCAGTGYAGWLLAKLQMLLFPMTIPSARSGRFFYDVSCARCCLFSGNTFCLMKQRGSLQLV